MHLCVVVGDKYIVADCGGGTVDLTVHQIEQPQGTLKELYKASGECRRGKYGHVLIITKGYYITVQVSEYIVINGTRSQPVQRTISCVCKNL